jgi:purine-binding chemotaxis protein CheW
MSNEENYAGQYCTFIIDGALYGIDVNEIQEVILFQEMTPAPHAPDAVRGLINLRGQVVIAIDMRTMLGLPKRPEEELSTNIVISSERGAVSLLVDEIGEVLDLESGFEEPPSTIRGPHRALVKAVCQLDGHLLHIVDVVAATTVRAAA